MIDLSFIKAIPNLVYEGLATIEEFHTEKDPKTKLTRPNVSEIVIENEPCRVSKSSQPISESDGLPSATQNVKLFIRPDIEIKAGSKITVTQHGETREYGLSGIPAKYCCHQEINLVKWDESL